MKVLLLILLLGFVLRVAGLSSHPAGFTPDEASFGFDAFSLLTTGRDQWGSFLPLSLKSFGDYKLPLYSYMSIPSIFVFGLNEFSVRLPNALIGSLAVIPLYLLTRELFGKKTAIIASLLLAVSPWHMPLARGAFEANLTVFFMPLAIWLFLKGLKNPKFMIFSAIFFGINLFTYHSARLVTPLIVFYLVLANFKHLSTHLNKYFLSLVLMLVFFAIGGYSLVNGSGARASTSTVFTSYELVFDDRVRAEIAGEPAILAKVFNNKATYVAEEILDKYLSYFSLRFLITDGPAEGTYGMLPGVGVIYFFEFVALLVFLIIVINKKISVPGWLTFWILVSPIPAAVSMGPGIAANRAAVMMPAIQILVATGLLFIWQVLKKKFGRSLTVSVFSFVIFVSVLFYVEDYFYQQPAREAQSMVYGSRQVMETILSIEDQYSKIIFTKRISEPHIFVAFYKNMNPVLFQHYSQDWQFTELGLDWVDQLPSYNLGKYEFKHIDWARDLKEINTLIVAPAREVPQTVEVLKQINYPNGNPAYSLVDTSLVKFAEK